MIHRLIKIANQLDAKCYYNLASEVDVILKIAVSQSDLIHALKNDDQREAMRTLSIFVNRVPYGSNVQQELNMTDQDYRGFVSAIGNDDLHEARRIFGIGESIDVSDPTKYSPFTGQPWGSELKQPSRSADQTLKDFVINVTNFVKNRGGTIKTIHESAHDLETEIIFEGLDEDAREEFEDVYEKSSFRDSEFGPVLVEAGEVDDGPDVGIYMLVAKLPDGIDSIANFVEEYIPM